MQDPVQSFTSTNISYSTARLIFVFVPKRLDSERLEPHPTLMSR